MSLAPAPFNPFAAVEPTVEEAADANFIFVDLPSGTPFPVLNEAEAEHLKRRVAEYLDQFQFNNVSDIAVLDAIVTNELIMFRDATWASRRQDYNGKPIDAATEAKLRQSVKELSAECRQLRKNVGIDKVARDRARGEGSIHQRWQNVCDRAERFGIHRNEQSAKAIELAMQGISLIDYFKNCTPDERDLLHMNEADIIEWFDTVFRPEFLALDEYFREHEQKLWVRDQ